MKARWPEVGVVDPTLLKEADYLQNVSHEFRVRIKKMMEMRGKVGHLMYSCHGDCVVMVTNSCYGDGCHD